MPPHGTGRVDSLGAAGGVLSRTAPRGHCCLTRERGLQVRTISFLGDEEADRLADRISDHYAAYGDNEFLVRIAEGVGPIPAQLDQDWSEGGAQWRR